MAFAWLLCHRLARAVHAKRVRDIRPCRICHLDYMPPSAFPDLTDREREILGMIALGRSNAEIAEELVLSPKTVSNHVSNMFSKLQVVDRAQAVLRARQAGLG